VTRFDGGLNAGFGGVWEYHTFEGDQGMLGKCEKRGSEKAASDTLRITDAIYKNVDTEDPIRLCEEHIKEGQRFQKTNGTADVKALKKWLEMDHS
jgi:hypothetical protein